MYLLPTEWRQRRSNDTSDFRKRMRAKKKLCGIVVSTMLIQHFSIEKSVIRCASFLLHFHFMWKTVINLLRARASTRTRTRPHGILSIYSSPPNGRFILLRTKRRNVFSQPVIGICEQNNCTSWPVNRAMTTSHMCCLSHQTVICGLQLNFWLHFIITPACFLSATPIFDARFAVHLPCQCTVRQRRLLQTLAPLLLFENHTNFQNDVVQRWWGSWYSACRCTYYYNMTNVQHSFL